jgi:YHS domain-containing protein
MVKDLVCGADVNEKQSMLKVDKDGSTHYFCSTGCLKRFKADSQKYIKAAAAK